MLKDGDAKKSTQQQIRTDNMVQIIKEWWQRQGIMIAWNSSRRPTSVDHKETAPSAGKVNTAPLPLGARPMEAFYSF
jgi:hypothetical protein